MLQADLFSVGIVYYRLTYSVGFVCYRLTCSLWVLCVTGWPVLCGLRLTCSLWVLCVNADLFCGYCVLQADLFSVGIVCYMLTYSVGIVCYRLTCSLWVFCVTCWPIQWVLCVTCWPVLCGYCVLHAYLFCGYCVLQADLFSVGIIMCEITARISADPDIMPRMNVCLMRFDLLLMWMLCVHSKMRFGYSIQNFSVYDKLHSCWCVCWFFIFMTCYSVKWFFFLLLCVLNCGVYVMLLRKIIFCCVCAECGWVWQVTQ